MKNRKRWVSVMAGVMAAIMLLSLILSLIPTRAGAASSSEIMKQLSDLKEDKKEIEAQLKEVKKQLNANDDEIEGIVGQKDAIDQAIDNRQQPLWNTAIGGAIMIQGQGEEGYGAEYDWTAGCIAVDLSSL